MSRCANNNRDLPTLQIRLTELTRSSSTNQCLIGDWSSEPSAVENKFSCLMHAPRHRESRRFVFLFFSSPQPLAESIGGVGHRYCQRTEISTSFEGHWLRADVYRGAWHRGGGAAPGAVWEGWGVEVVTAASDLRYTFLLTTKKHCAFALWWQENHEE